MARLPRLKAAGYAQHVIHRGNNRQSIFLSDADYAHFLALLEKYLPASGCELNAYVLMTNHVHLLVTPRTQEGLPKLMQAVARDYTRYFNKKNGRSGTLWEGRYRSSIIETERYLLACMAYIDLNPVRAGMVNSASEYSYSSYRHYAGVVVNALITASPGYWALGNTPFSREQAYRDLVAAGLPQQLREQLSDHALHGWPMGSQQFLGSLEEASQRRASKAERGRPKKGMNKSHQSVPI